MTNNLPSIPEKAKAVWRIVKAAGPLLIAQSPKLSEAIAKHQLRLATVEAIKELMVAEARTIVEIRKKLIERYLDAAPEDRLRLRQDIDSAERDLRQLGVYQKAIEYVPESHTAPATTSENENIDPPEDFKAWLDTFNDYARKQKEPWRTDLLARALALESATPGALGQRALWFIGTVDEKAFHAFAAILDTALHVNNGYVIPNYDTYCFKTIPTYTPDPEQTLSTILYLLTDLGLIGDMITTVRIYKSNNPITVSYGHHKIIASLKQDIRIKGVMLTGLGDTIAQLYEPKANELGLEIYNTWINSMRTNSITVIQEI